MSTITFSKSNLSLKKTQPKLVNNYHIVLVDITQANMKCVHIKTANRYRDV